MGVCAADGIGWFFNFFADTGHGGFFCNHVDGIANGTLPGGGRDWTAGEGWVNPAQIAVLDDGTRVGILEYGRVMRAGDVSCSVQPDGLTCNAPATSHGFTVNTASYVSW